MSVVFSGTNQGRFIANGQNVFIPMPAGVDWMHVVNESQASLTPALVGFTSGTGGFSGTFTGGVIGEAFFINGTTFTIVGATGALTPSGNSIGTGTYNVSTGALTFTAAALNAPIFFIQSPADGEVGVKFDWYLGDAIGRGYVDFVNMSVSNALSIQQIAPGAGFYFINTTNSQPGPLNNGSTGISAISTATPPVVTVGSTANMFTGQTVQLYNVVGAPQLSGLQFSITVLSGTTFALTNMQSLSVAATGGDFRVIPYQPLYVAPIVPGVTSLSALQDPYWYPTYRVITNISQSFPAIITLAVKHTYTVGQSVMLQVPVVSAAAFGMPSLNGLQSVTIVAVGAADADGYVNTISVDLDTTGIGPFAFPLAADPGFSPAAVYPSGENTAQALASNVNILGDSTVNQSAFGLLLVAGDLSPAGQSGDVIQWLAGKSFNGS